MTRFLELLARGATIDAAAAAAGLDRDMAEIMVDHYERAGLIAPPRSVCTTCPAQTPRRFGCAGCPFAAG